jgi:predicted nucleic acid-binding protein
MIEIVVDTTVFVAALRSGGGAAREALRRCLTGHDRPLFGHALWLEYEDMLSRDRWCLEFYP